MNETDTIKEKKVSRKLLLTGISIFLIVTISLIVAKIIYWTEMSFWWILLPSGLVIVWVLVLLAIELSKSPEN